jgi:hypothetical protein
MARLQMRQWPERHCAQKFVRSWQSVKQSVTAVFVTDCCSCNTPYRKNSKATRQAIFHSLLNLIPHDRVPNMPKPSVILNQTLSELTSIGSSGELWRWYRNCSLWKMQLVIWFSELAFAMLWRAGKGVACNGSRHSTRGNNRWHKPPSLLLLQRAATCLHFLPRLSISLLSDSFISNFFVLISPLLFTFLNCSNLPFFVLLSTFFSFQYPFFLCPFFVFIRFCRSISFHFLSCFSFYVFLAFIFICLLILVCYLPICLFLPLRICSLFLQLLLYCPFSASVFSALFTSLFGLCLYLFLFTYIY